MPPAGQKPVNRAAAHYKWAQRYAKRENIASSLAHLRRAIRYTTAFGQIKCLLYNGDCTHQNASGQKPRSLLMSLTRDTQRGILLDAIKDTSIRGEIAGSELIEGSDVENYKYVITDCIDAITASEKQANKPRFFFLVLRESWKQQESAAFLHTLAKIAEASGYSVSPEHEFFAWFESKTFSSQIYYRVLELNEVKIKPH